MPIAHRTAAFAFRAAAAFVVLVGIARVSGLWTSAPTWTAFLYYTVLSNVLCLVWLVWSAVVTLRDARDKGWYGHSTPSARGAAAVMMAITVTLLIYVFVLAPSLFTQPGAYEPFTLTDNLVHIITPLLLIVDWFLFVPKGEVRRGDPLLWAAIPYSYLVFAFVYGALGGRFAAGARYPYPFMNVETNGLPGVVAWIAVLTVALVAVGYGYYSLDRALSRRRRPTSVTAQKAGRALTEQ